MKGRNTALMLPPFTPPLLLLLALTGNSEMKQLKKLARQTGFIFKETFNGFLDDNGLKLSAALSYYTIFSLPPLLIIIISLGGIFFGTEAVEGKIFGQINGLVGNGPALQIQEIIKNVKLLNGNVWATII